MIITRTETIGDLIILCDGATLAGDEEIIYAPSATPALSFRR